MDTNSNFDLDNYISELEQNDAIPDWFDIQDLNRLSIERHQIDQGIAIRQLAPKGALRLTGEGVDGHSLSLNAAGDVLKGFQNLVTAIGASLNGIKTSRGKLPSFVSDLTELALDASPAPGSVVLKFVPRLEAKERDKQLELELDEGSLVERTLDQLIDALSISGDSEQEFLDKAGAIDQSGPRVVSAAKLFMQSLSSNGLDLDLKWRSPSHKMKKAFFRASQAKALSEALSRVETDSGAIYLSAIVKRVSDVPNPHLILDVEAIEEDVVHEMEQDRLTSSVKESIPGEIMVSLEEDDSRYTSLRLNDEVRALIAVDATRFPGSTWKFAFVLTRWD